MKKYFALFFFGLLLVNIVSREAAVDLLPEITKPLLMPVLFYMVWKESLGQHIVLAISLIFSWMGDIFLMFSGELYFMLGLGSFLIAHLFYLFIFLKFRETDFLKVLPFLAFSSLMILGVLGTQLPESLRLPVGSYVVVITLMGIAAAMASKLPLASYRLVITGAVLFILSDSFIAVDKFVNPVPFSSFWVMSTYGAAQFLIVKGLIQKV
jgi:uncharacterized membrane protein YhhN